MKPLLTKAQYRDWKAQWRRVNTFERRELRQMTMGDKLRPMAALMASADLFAEDPVREKEVAVVRERWNKARRAFEMRMRRKPSR